MRLWRISNFANLSGHGGLLASGRWHTRGRRVVYLSDHPASALIEVLVHLETDPEDLPAAFQFLAVDAPDEVAFETIVTEHLPARWTDDPSATRARGDAWLADGRTAILRVPSAIVPFAYNWLLNPAHPDAARLHIAEVVHPPFDRRLLG